MRNAPLRSCPLGQWDSPDVDEIIDKNFDPEKCSAELSTLTYRSPTRPSTLDSDLREERCWFSGGVWDACGARLGLGRPGASF